MSTTTPTLSNTTKICSKCDTDKPITEYATGQGRCNPCRREISRAYRKAQGAGTRARNNAARAEARRKRDAADAAKIQAQELHAARLYEARLVADPYLTDWNREDFDRISEHIRDFALKIQFLDQEHGPACWIWTAGASIQVTEDGKRYSTTPRARVYDLVNDTNTETRSFLSTICGQPNCVSPDHVTDEHNGYWEDFEFLLDTWAHPFQIPDRLGVTVESMQNRADSTEDPHRKTLYLRYQQRVVDAHEEEAALLSETGTRKNLLGYVAQKRNALEAKLVA